ncbi:hypothetical protein V7266_10860 [Neobacillus drentensis]|uniref:hypothetical protein n=1 Tax=Neobacillus drentensis TaxID=220684 RepID=UPI002FFEF283
MKIGDYKVEKLLSTNDDLSFLIVRDSGQKTFMLRKLNRPASDDAWFECYEDYQLNITNFKYLPKPLVVSTHENKVYTTFPYEDGTILSEGKQLSQEQMEQLIEAVSHLHKKGFIHGSIDENHIWIRETGDVQLFGAGEKKVLTPSAPVPKQADYDSIFSIIKRLTTIEVKDGLIPTSLEQLLDLLQTVQIKPSLVEKETIDNRAAVPEVFVDSRAQVPEEKIPRKRRKWWMIGGGIALLLFAVITVSYFSNDSSIQTTKAEKSPTTQMTNAEKSPTAQTTNAEKSPAKAVEREETKPPKIDLTQFAALFPNWQFIKQETVKINRTYYTILGIGLKGTDGEMGKAKVVVLDYNAEADKWSKKWESQEYEVDSSAEMESYLDMLLLNPQDQKKALLVFGTYQYRAGYDVYALEVDEEGNGKIAWEDNGYTLKKKDDSILVSQLGETYLTLSNNQLNVKEVGRSDAGPANAVKAHFILNKNGLVVPTGDRNINLKVGEVLSFIPDNDETKRQFDKGEISLYTNMGNSGSVNTSNAEMISGGNSVEFTEMGTFEFLLDYYDEESGSYLDNPPATFVVQVGDGNADSQQNTSEISTPFKIGAGLSELINYYGQPEYDEGYEGSRLVTFDKDGYLLDEAEIVTGYYFSNPEISIYNAHVGMTPNEISSILGNPSESYLDQEFGGYSTVYHKDGYEILFRSSKQNGSTTAVQIVQK